MQTSWRNAALTHASVKGFLGLERVSLEDLGTNPEDATASKAAIARLAEQLEAP